MRYTHIGLADKTRAIANLPAPNGAQRMRSIPGVVDVNIVALDGTGVLDKKRQNPSRCKGFVTDRRCLARSDSVEAAGLLPPPPGLFQS